MELQVVKGGIGSIIYRFLLLGIIVQTPPFGGQKKIPYQNQNHIHSSTRQIYPVPFLSLVLHGIYTPEN